MKEAAGSLKLTPSLVNSSTVLPSQGAGPASSPAGGSRGKEEEEEVRGEEGRVQLFLVVISVNLRVRQYTEKPISGAHTFSLSVFLIGCPDTSTFF